MDLMVDAGADPVKSDLLLMNVTIGKITQLVMEKKKKEFC